MRNFISFWILAVSAFLVSVHSASAAYTAVSWSNGDAAPYDGFNYASAYSIGYSFTVGASNLTVSKIGMYDFGNDGLTGTQKAAIFTFPAGVAVTPEYTITSSDYLDLATHYHWLDVTPFTLLAGQSYVIGSKAPQGGPAGTAAFFTGLAYAPGITFTGARYTFTGDTTLVAPLTLSGNEVGWFAPNFGDFVIPEPASIVLLAGGAVMMLRRAAPVAGHEEDLE